MVEGEPQPAVMYTTHKEGVYAQRRSENTPFTFRINPG